VRERAWAAALRLLDADGAAQLEIAQRIGLDPGAQTTHTRWRAAIEVQAMDAVSELAQQTAHQPYELALLVAGRLAWERAGGDPLVGLAVLIGAAVRMGIEAGFIPDDSTLSW
jgi:hypothetical protein